MITFPTNTIIINIYIFIILKILLKWKKSDLKAMTKYINIRHTHSNFGEHRWNCRQHLLILTVEQPTAEELFL